MTDTATKDVILIHRIVQRDQQALTELYNRHGRLVYNMARHVLQDSQMAEEVTQDVFFQIWRWPERWDENRAKLSTWMLAIARYTAIDYLRREQRRPKLAPTELEDLSHRLPSNQVVGGVERDNKEIIKAVMAQLPKEQRTVIMLAYYRGLTHEEIAEKLNLPLGTVKSRIRLGMKKLKDGWIQAVQPAEAEQNSP